MFDNIRAVMERDPAARGFFGAIEVVLSCAGLHALWFYRLSHFLYTVKLPVIPRLVSQFARFLTGIEIHPAAKIGKRFFIDHGMGVVIGETAQIGDDVTLFQGVTLGGTGKETGKRHPTLRNNIYVGAGAKILGNIEIGSNVKIGANSVVLHNIPDDSTVVGVPARVVRSGGIAVPDAKMPDPVKNAIDGIVERLACIEAHMKCNDKNSPDCLSRLEKSSGI